MNRKDWFIVLLLLTVLMCVVVFISPVNWLHLEPKEGSSGISSWEYIPGDMVSEDYEAAGNSIEGWKPLTELTEDMTVEPGILWLRGRLSEELNVYSPALFLELDFPVEVFVEGQSIYSYGSVEDINRVLAFDHIVPVEDSYRGKLIYFRYPLRKAMTQSELRYLTGWDMVSEREKTAQLIFRQMYPLFLCSMGVFVGLCLMGVAVFQKLKRGSEAGLLANAGIFLALISINIINSLYVVCMALNNPVATFYLDYISYFLIPYSAGSFILELIKTGPRKTISIINRVFLLFLIAVLMLSRVPGFDISRSDYVFDIIFLSYSIFMMRLLFKEFSEGNKDLKLIMAGLLFIGITGVIDILSLLKVARFYTGVTHLGIFVLSLCMVAFFALRYQRLFEDVMTANTLLVRSKEEIESINRDLDRKVIEKTAAIRNLFDNAEQGFLSFGKELTVDSEYSLKCCEIFGCDIGGQSLPELISGGDVELEDFVQALLKSVFDPDDAARREVYLSLLPEELKVCGKTVSLDYKMIDRDTEASDPICMVILTDVTERKSLETSLERERSILKMCVAVVANHTDFVNTVTDYNYFCSCRIGEILDSSSPVESKYAELFRLVHTFKGTFAYFEMKNTTVKLHKLETEIYKLGQQGMGPGLLKELFEGISPSGWLEEDYDILRNLLGERYLKLDRLVVAEESRIREIEDKILSAFTGEEGNRLVKEIKRLRYRTLKDMLGHYPVYCQRLAERLEKQLAEFEIQGSDIEVDPEVYSGLCKSMVHIFRNLADHGIEAPEERVYQGKSEIGNITCSIIVNRGCVEIIAADDGSGIDMEETREIAVARGLLAAEEAVAASEEKMLELLFADGFSTVREVNELSGRGVGLAAVKAEVMKLKGSIEVRSRKGIGTSYHITVPLLD